MLSHSPLVVQPSIRLRPWKAACRANANARSSQRHAWQRRACDAGMGREEACMHASSAHSIAGSSSSDDSNHSPPHNEARTSSSSSWAAAQRRQLLGAGALLLMQPAWGLAQLDLPGAVAAEPQVRLRAACSAAHHARTKCTCCIIAAQWLCVPNILKGRASCSNCPHFCMWRRCWAAGLHHAHMLAMNGGRLGV